jgi:hypothetical protein
MSINLSNSRFSLRAILYLFVLVILQLPVTDSRAAFPVHAHRITAEQTIQQPVQLHPEAPVNDGYKGIIAIAAGGTGMMCLIVGLAVSSVGFIFPAFVLGIGGIVFGALRKKTNKGLGRAGLVLGILDVALVVLFVVAVIIALASFT